MTDMMVHGMNKRFVKQHGYKALMKKCKKPLTRLMIERFLSLPEGTKLGCVTVSAKSKGYKDWRCLNAPVAQTGLRADEVVSRSVKEGLTTVQFNRASVTFSVGGTMYADPDPQVLRMFGNQMGLSLHPGHLKQISLVLSGVTSLYVYPSASTTRYAQHENWWNKR